LPEKPSVVLDVSHRTDAFPESKPSGPEPPATIVVMGASGDLTSRKLIPALFHLAADGYLAPETIIVGAARRRISTDAFREEMREAVRRHSRTQPLSDGAWSEFARRLHYQVVEFDTSEHYAALRDFLESHEAEHALRGDRVFYLASAPQHFLPIVRHLGEARLIRQPRTEHWSRVVIEKPFGSDLSSARDLNAALAPLLHETQVYRMDHYLGKDTVQNVLAFRLGNGIFEPLFNRHHVDHVAITVAEDHGIESGRGAYYDTAGALRDVAQNHLLQLLCLVAMEPPAVGGAREIRDEKVKVLQCLRAPERFEDWAVRGQYGASDGMRAYREEDRVAPDSRTETYCAFAVEVDNWRWAGVPFFLRTGKRMPEKRTEIAVRFRRPPMQLFRTVACADDVCWLTPQAPNAIVFRVQPDEGVDIVVSVKRPGMNMDLHQVDMGFSYQEAFPQPLPDAYERLLVDVMRGDQTLFTRADEIERAWEFFTPLLEYWSYTPPEDFPNYPAGTWGPSAADALLARRGAAWGSHVP